MSASRLGSADLKFWASEVCVVLLFYRCREIKSDQNQKRIYIAPCVPQIQRRLADGLSEAGIPGVRLNDSIPVDRR